MLNTYEIEGAVYEGKSEYEAVKQAYKTAQRIEFVEYLGNNAWTYKAIFKSGTAKVMVKRVASEAASSAARALGSIRTDKKAKASRDNGKLGGRPLSKSTIIDRLNDGADPQSLGFTRQADDGQGNSYWTRNQGTTIIRLNRFEDEETGNVTWDDDVSGWEK